MTAITLASWAPPAAAKARTKKQRVRRYKSRAFKAFAKGRYEVGIKNMRKAHALLPHPGFLLNIALGYDQWGEHCGEALDSLDQFFEACPDCKLRPKGTVTQTEIRQRCPTRVRLTTDPSGAQLSVDGQAQGISPLTLELPPGPHQISALRPGYQQSEDTIEVSYGAENAFGLSLKAVPAPEPPPFAGAPPPPTETTPPPPTTIRGTLTPIKDPPTRLTPWAWGAFGVAAAGAAVGTVFTLQTFSALDAEEQARADRLTKREVEALQDKAINRALTANIGFGVAAAGLVSGVVLLILDPGDPDDAAPDETALTPIIGPRGVGVHLRF